MAKLHMKGFILQLLDEHPEGLWDYEIADKTLAEYGKSGDYWKGTIRVVLTDLYSGGLIEEVEENLDNGQHFGVGKVLMKYKVSNFGHQRMVDTGII